MENKKSKAKTNKMTKKECNKNDEPKTKEKKSNDKTKICRKSEVESLTVYQIELMRHELLILCTLNIDSFYEHKFSA